MRKMNQSGWNIYMGQNIIVNVSKHLKPIFLFPVFFNIINTVTPQSFLFIYSKWLTKDVYPISFAVVGIKAY